MTTTINVLKLGGGAGVDAAPVLRNLAARVRAGERWALVHGASDAANRNAMNVSLAQARWVVRFISGSSSYSLSGSCRLQP